MYRIVSETAEYRVLLGSLRGDVDYEIRLKEKGHSTSHGIGGYVFFLFEILRAVNHLLTAVCRIDGYSDESRPGGEGGFSTVKSPVAVHAGAFDLYNKLFLIAENRRQLAGIFVGASDVLRNFSCQLQRMDRSDSTGSIS